MRAIDLFRGEAARLPKPPRVGDFRAALANALDAYYAQVDLVDGDDYASREVRAARPLIHELGQRLLIVLEASLRGQPAKARTELEVALSAVRPYIDALRSIEIEGSKLGVLYRLRRQPPGRRLLRPDLFHIPFEKRNLVAPQRFSVIGVPMLYLGSTVYVCWEELGRPPLHELWASAFRIREPNKARVLNLAYRPGYFAELLELAGNPGSRSDIAALSVAGAVVWPLLASCTFQVAEEGAFKVEHVVPQLLMSWLAETEEYIGVRYFSTHVRTPAAMFASINFVFPSRDISQTGHCTKLAGLFEMTEPVSWAYAEAIGTQSSYFYHGRTKATVELGEGHAVRYEATQFAVMEHRLDQLKFGPVC